MANKAELAAFVERVSREPGITKSQLCRDMADRHAVASLVKHGRLIARNVAGVRSAKLYASNFVRLWLVKAEG